MAKLPSASAASRRAPSGFAPSHRRPFIILSLAWRALALILALYTIAGSSALASLTWTYNAATDVPVSANGYIASGTATLALNFAPPVGANLTVVSNTGQSFITGTFSNLVQGQPLELTYNGITYNFVANYYGGTGNDLVLQWANVRLWAWGYDNSGELGNDSTTSSTVAVAVDQTGVLNGKTVVAFSAGGFHSLAICSDGTLAAWGLNQDGELGNNSTTATSAPVAVVQSGALAGKTVVAVAGGYLHSLVLCSDGTVAAWGFNYVGELGNNTTTQSAVPVSVDQTGVLYGKTVTAISAGYGHNLALCSDGTLAAWGYNSNGQLGCNSTAGVSLIPVAVDQTGVLAGKTITAISAGYFHSLALCSDGTVAAWGENFYGELGNNSTTDSNVPVAVNQSGVLAGKEVVAVAAGGYFSLALCSDGTIVAWGENNDGQLGNNSTSQINVPVAVYRSGPLAGQTAVGLSAGNSHSLARCSDGTLATWGYNAFDQLGDGGTASSDVPVAVTSAPLGAGQSFVAAITGSSSYHTLALVASPPSPPSLPVVTTLPASAISSTGATLNGAAAANSSAANVSFDYGPTTAYGKNVAGSPTPISGGNTIAASASLTGLTPGTTYHFRINCASGAGTTNGNDLTFRTISSNASLSNLTLSDGVLSPAFASAATSYTAVASSNLITLTPTLADSTATVTVNGTAVASGSASGAIPLSVGPNTITTTVTAQDGLTTQTYTVVVTLTPLSWTYSGAGDVPVSASIYGASGTAELALNFAPPVGTNLMVVNNTGLGFISGTFANLAQGQAVALSYDGATYNFVVNYFGGTGNDLVLQWANVQTVAWGYNGSGQLGNNTTANSLAPTPVASDGPLSGQTILSLAAGGYHSLALCANGLVAAWGSNAEGQLGNNSATDSPAPTPVLQSGALAGKTVVALAAGEYFTLALCSDGTLAAWGDNTYGQLGNGATSAGSTPVTVSQTGALSGKTVVAISAGSGHCVALCSDGTLAAWGNNGSGQLGNNSTANSPAPVAVKLGGFLTGRTAIAVSAGAEHTLALCSDGTLAAWGDNSYGELGNTNVITQTSVPVPVVQNGVLAGKTVISLAAGSYYSLALCSDGTLAAWGDNSYGELGDGNSTQSNVPATVTVTGALSGEMITAVSGGWGHSLAVCSDGTAAAWGYNGSGELGNNSAEGAFTPVAVNGSGLAAGERLVAALTGPNAAHSLALFASPGPIPTATTLSATLVTATGATLNGIVNANGGSAAVSFDYGVTPADGADVDGAPTSVSGMTATPVSATLTGLNPGTTYYFRINAANGGATANGGILAFTTLDAHADLSNLALSSGPLSPPFSSGATSYTAATSSGSLTVTPTATDSAATVSVNGATLGAGSPSGAIPLSLGPNTITIIVTAPDGVTTQTYTVIVTLSSLSWTYNSAGDMPVSANGYTASGSANLSLNFAPSAGTNLTVVNNTGPGFISGMFGNLAQGQAVEMSYNGVAYQFVANYYGGTGNDLVLQWANVRLLAWGYGPDGQLGNDSSSSSPLPVAVDETRALAGKTVIGVSTGLDHSLAVCADGTVAAWGSNEDGQLGNNSALGSSAPVAIGQYGVLAGKTVIAVAAGYLHSLALCSDGTVAAWGFNYVGELGDNSTTESETPVAVNQSGVLAGKTVTAISAGYGHNLALCSDGTLAAWGYNGNGQLGSNSAADMSLIPVAVDQAGALAGKTITAISAGYFHSLALCSDGTVAAWGENFYGEIGNNSTTDSHVPVAVNQNGALAGKMVIAVAAGGYHSLALCSDGTVVAWGEGFYDALGDNSTSQSNVPVAVYQSGLLAGKIVTSISAGNQHSLALCSDGTLAAWGYNTFDQLGDNSAASSDVPVAVTSSSLGAGERFLAAISGSSSDHTLALIASPPSGSTMPVATTLPATSLTATGATLNGAVVANGNSANVTFDYGPTTAYGTTVAGAPTPISGDSTVLVSASLVGLAPGTYHFRANCASGANEAYGNDLTFTTIGANANLSDLTLSVGALSPAFAAGTNSYSATTSSNSITVTPTAASSGATVTVNGQTVASGSASGAILLNAGPNTITTIVTAPNGVTTQTYTVVVTRSPLTWTYNGIGDVPVNANGYNASGTATFALNFAPPVGANLTVVSNTGQTFITGTFSNLAQGQPLELTYNGITYNFVANYYGGTGNDLVLQWANVRLWAWGYGNSGELGDDSASSSTVPVTVDQTGVLNGKTVTAFSAGGFHSLAVCSDGTLAAWGNNQDGQLGNNSTTATTAPVAVVQSGALAGKTVVAAAGGYLHSLALCSDGTVTAWGFNYVGELGNNSTTQSAVPVAVDQTGVLYGKTVTAISAGYGHNLALCSDGSLAAWGYNGNGQLGGNSTADMSLIPVAVDQSGVLAGKTITAISAGYFHSLALCSDGTVAAWGENFYGELGNNSTTDSNVPVAVNQSGVLAGKTVVAVAAGGYHSLALCSDGTVVAWGEGYYDALGDNSTSQSNVPVAVDQGGLLAGKMVASISAGNTHSLALCSEGTLAAWGFNSFDQLGDSTTASSDVPVAVSSSPFGAGERFVAAISGSSSDHTLALVAAPPAAPTPTSLPATFIGSTGATLNGTINANGNTASASFEYGLTTAYGATVAGAPTPVTGDSAKPVSAVLTGLTPGTIYHFRVDGSSGAGAATGVDLTFKTTSTDANLANLALSSGVLSPPFATGTTSYSATTSANSVTLTPTAADLTATITVNAAPALSGTSSGAIPLSLGANTITTVVTAQDGVTSLVYTVTITEIPPPSLSLPASPVIADATSAGGAAVAFTVTAQDGLGDPLSPTVNPPSGSLFALGNTTVNISAIDSFGTATTGSFIVTVQDTTPPMIFPHPNVTLDATAPGGAVVTYAPALATDNVGVTSLTYSQDSGTFFPLGVTTVVITASDDAGNTSSASFTVTVTQPLVANPDTVYLTGMAPVVIHVLANDLDQVPGSMRITSVSLASFGQTALTGNGSTVTYTPRSSFTGFAGTDSFTYTITDSRGETASAPVTVRNPFYLIKGSYDGLLIASGGAVTANSSGYLRLSLTTTGAFTGALRLEGMSYALAGAFDVSGTANVIIKRDRRPSITIRLALDEIDGSNIFGTISTGATTYTVNTGARERYDALVDPDPSAGTYTVLLPAPPLPASQAAVNVTIGPPSATVPQGTGWATMTVSDGGRVTLAGRLGDGKPFAASAFVHGGPKDSFSLYAPLYTTGQPGSLYGAASFENLTASDCDAELTWCKPAQTVAGPYQSGFSARVGFQGARYAATPAKQVLDFTNQKAGAAAFELSLGNLRAPIIHRLSVSSANVVTVTNPSADALIVTINRLNGTFYGSFRANPSASALDPSARLVPTTVFSGAIDQKANIAAGVFLGPTQAGNVALSPQ